MPKFSLRWEALLNDPLQALGMRQAFEGGRADFSRMSSTAGDRLYISRVKQKSFVDVHEEGHGSRRGDVGRDQSDVRVRSAGDPHRSAIRVRDPRAPVGTIMFLGKIVRPPA